MAHLATTISYPLAIILKGKIAEINIQTQSFVRNATNFRSGPKRIGKNTASFTLTLNEKGLFQVPTIESTVTALITSWRVSNLQQSTCGNE